MDTQMIFNIVIAVLLVIIAGLLIAGKSKSGIDKIVMLLKKSKRKTVCCNKHMNGWKAFCFCKTWRRCSDKTFFVKSKLVFLWNINRVISCVFCGASVCEASQTKRSNHTG